MNRLTRTVVWCLLSCTIMALAFPLESFAQQATGEIQGKVTAEGTRGEPLIGANVMLVGTIFGIKSDLNGEFIIKRIPVGTYTISASYLGYKKQTRSITITAGRVQTANFALVPTAVQADEVVVTGQGAAIEKKKMPTPVESLRGNEIQFAPAQSVDQLLQGRIPGLSAFSMSGLPGASSRMGSRGIKSALLSSTPVIYVDGVRVDANDDYRLANSSGGTVTSSLSDLVTGEIDRIEFIPGGAASTLYGSEAANGVLQIFTKKGLPGMSQWRASVSTGVDAPENKFVKEQFTKDKILQTGSFQSYGLGVAGGDQNFSYNVSGKMSYNTGLVTKNKTANKLYNISAGLRSIISEKSDVEFSGSYTRSKFGRILNSNLGSISPYVRFECEAGTRSTNPDSILAGLLEYDEYEISNRWLLSVNYNYRPIQDMTIKITTGLDNRKSENRQFASIASAPYVLDENGSLGIAYRDYLTYTFSAVVSYVLPQIGPVSQTFSAGVQGFRVEDREANIFGDDFSIPGTDDVGNTATWAADESNRQLFNGGFFFTDQIGLMDHIYADVGMRFDGNSAFGKDVGLQAYPKAGLSYVVSDADYYPIFMKGYLSSVKLRTSWGQTGNFPPPFTRDRIYSANSYMGSTGIGFANAGDPNLKPEKTTATDFGFDLGFLGDKISFGFTYYSQITKDALFSVPTDPAGGFPNQQRNVGQIDNNGIELRLRANILDEEDVKVNTQLSYNTINNKVTDLGGQTGFSIAGFSYLPSRVEKGYPVGVFRVNKPVADTDGVYRGRYISNILEGNPSPTRTGSISFDIVLFQDITITALGEFAAGHKVADHMIGRRLINAYTDAYALLPDVPGQAKPTPTTSNPLYPYNRNNSTALLLEDGDWFKLREITISYRMPKLIFQNLTIWASGRNLYTWTKAKVDPELVYLRGGQIFGGLETGGTSGAIISPPIQIRVGMDVQF